MRRGSLAAKGVALGLALAAAGAGASGVATASTGRGSSGGTTVTFAGLVGEPPTYFFPMYTSAYWDTGYVPWASYLMWPPIYRWGNAGRPVFNEGISLALPPVISTDAAGDSVVTITLKKRRWSDGRPVTTRDVEFWMNLLRVEKTNFAPYVPGSFPDNVKSVSYLSSRTFRLVFDKHYSSYWLTGNELTQITPIPQHAWDKTSAKGPVGNYDLTPKGARAVYNFLQGQAQSKSTFATNPLWQVVDGPWHITSYNATSGEISFGPSPTYPWPQKQKISTFTELPFTSSTAEFSALESGTIDVGYVPLSSLRAIPSLEARGYKIADWTQSAFGGLIFQYAKDDKAAPILGQLYVRQALTHLIDMKTINDKIWGGLASYASGPVPNPSGRGLYVSAAERKDPYPYDVQAARSLLTSHGWHVVPNGTSTCERPGTGASDCGAGIARGAKLSFNVIGTESSNSEYRLLQYLVSSFSAVGVHSNVKLVPDASLASDAAECIGKTTCPWDMELWMGEWPLGWTPYVETGGNTFACGAASNYLSLCNAYDDKLIAANHSSSDPVKALEQWENYMVREQFQIYLPIPPYRVVAYRSNLAGVTPLDPYLQIFPEDWHTS
jgi:peptide/nickel transport system substrate-binding protein